ncbi:MULTISPECIES: ABC transporter ATP-binding protein [Herpetosiphon]|uniref:Sodium ABC transporter n=1 Tax=Herpetosiphon geysericola TaxID=70996 RepID=A0A0P6Y3F0_9CHLR|nr:MULTISPECIES: ATP-binding cassette domain-containing protein [Herpetosiphon]KPL79444.1 sodium ABC transporter [Herpetosiphon geysericola]
MAMLNVVDVKKSFAGTQAVRGVSFNVEPGELFGVLGPNGAGKTTTIRMILDILRPDSGSIEVLGGPMDESKKNRIGYLPEERGLYRNLKVIDCMVYLATLKGIERNEARKRASAYLERVELGHVAQKKVSELSKGMQQKVQFGTTILHEPDIVIIDEPFEALDPVNTRMVKDLLFDIRREGRAVLMCTHQMHLIEEMCDRIVMFNRGEIVLNGTLRDVRRRFAPNAVWVEGNGSFDNLPGIESVQTENGQVQLNLQAGTSPQSVFQALASRGDTSIDRFEVAIPSLDDIFVRVVNGERGQ